MRICLVGQATFEEEAGGAARHLSGLAAQLRRSGHDAHVLTAARFLPTRGPFGRGEIGRLVRAMSRMAIVLPAGMLFVVRHRPDVVAITFPLDGLGALAGAALTGRPVVAIFNGPWAREVIAAGDVNGRGGASALRRAIERLVYRRAARCISLSSAFGEILVRDYGVHPGRLRVIPGGIDPKLFPMHDRHVARASLGLRDGPTIVSVRRLVPRVGLDLVIEALARFAGAERPRLVIAGTGPERAALVALAQHLGVADSVDFPGFVPDDQLPTLYAAADVCVMPSRELEGFGYGVLEALAAGTPVVATRTDGLAELVGGIEPRWLVATDADALAATLRQVLESPDDFPARSACREYAANFAWPLISARTVHVFEEAISASTLTG